MSDTVLVALIAAAGTIIGPVLGVMTFSSLTNHRISQLEKKQDKHNSLIERMTFTEGSLKAAWERIDAKKVRIDNLEIKIDKLRETTADIRAILANKKEV